MPMLAYKVFAVSLLCCSRLQLSVVLAYVIVHGAKILYRFILYVLSIISVFAQHAVSYFVLTLMEHCVLK